jgi:hypothetical protein
MTQSMPPAKQSHTLRNIIIGVLVALFACVLCIGVVFAVTGGAILNAVNGLQVVGDRANEFMTALKADDYNKAYSLVVKEQQQAFGGSPEGMQGVLEGLHLNDPSDWKFPQFNAQNNQAIVSGTATFKDGSSKEIRVDLQKSGDTWYILGYGPNTQ